MIQWEAEGFPGPAGECKSPQVLSAYKADYDPRGVYLYGEGGYTGVLTTAPRFGCFNWKSVL